MKTKRLLPLLLVAVLLLGVAVMATTALAAPPNQAETSLTVLNPQGEIPVVGKLAPRLSSLDGKKVALWLMLPNTFEFQTAGKAYYERMAEMLKKQYPNVTLILPEELDNSSEAAKSLASIVEAKPDAALLGMGG